MMSVSLPLFTLLNYRSSSNTTLPDKYYFFFLPLTCRLKNTSESFSWLFFLSLPFVVRVFTNWFNLELECRLKGMSGREEVKSSIQTFPPFIYSCKFINVFLCWSYFFFRFGSVEMVQIIREMAK